jgi:hypothetical protein
MKNYEISLLLIEEIKQINKDRMVLAVDNFVPHYNVYLRYKELTRDSDPDTYNDKGVIRNSISNIEAYKRWYASKVGKIAGALLGALAAYSISNEDLVNSVVKILISAFAGGSIGSQIGHNLMAGRDWSKKEFEKADNLEK